MNGAYSELYLEDAMRNMGEMTEYAKEQCELCLDTLFHMFTISGYAERWEKGDPAVICGMSGTELCLRIMQKCGMEDAAAKPALIRYETNEDYWAGYFIAYYQWEKRKAFRYIFSSIHESDLFRVYPSLHMVSEEKGAEVIDQLIANRNRRSRLQAYRKQLGLSQQQLAEQSGVNLRTLQQYEVRRKELKKAAAETVFSLAEALRCRPEALIS